MRIYLDSCCFNRPFDALNHERIRLEAEAVLAILDSDHEKISCEPLFSEIAAITNREKRERVNSLLTIATRVEINASYFATRTAEIASLGFRPMDAAHLACAELAAADWFLSTDDILIRRATRLSASLKVAVANPAQWVLTHPL